VTPEKTKVEVADPSSMAMRKTDAQMPDGEEEVANEVVVEQKPSPSETAANNMASLDVANSASDMQAPRMACPKVDTKLRCDSFEGDTSVVCVVESVREDMGMFVVRIPALGNRRWPFSVDRLTGDKLVYVASDYPAFGASAAFDEKFRAHLKGRELTDREKNLLAKTAFVPPHKARPGYMWVMVAIGPVSAVAYNYDGRMVKADHPVSRKERDAYLEMLCSTARPLIKEGILLDCEPSEKS
jgi:hypothetical protein